MIKLDPGQINCADGKQGLGEDGVDCGPVCPMMPSCATM